MTHKPNPKHQLPVQWIAYEYERELAALQARVEGLETALGKIAYSRGPLYFDPQEPGLDSEPEDYIHYIRDIARAALSPKGETL